MRRATSDWSLSSPPADHAVHVVANQVHGAVAHAQVELDVGNARLEIRQVRNDEQLRHRGAHVHPQPAHGVGAGVGHAGFNVIQVRQQPHGALVVGRAIGRHGHAAGGAVEQLHAGLPPTLVLVGDTDPMRDEALAYAARLHAAGLQVTQHVFAKAEKWPEPLLETGPHECPCAGAVQEEFRRFFEATRGRESS